MIHVDPEARAFIAARGGTVHLQLARVVHGGCGVPPLEDRPAVRLGAPAEPERWAPVEVDGVTVHVPRALDPALALTLRVASVLGWRRLVVDGWNPIASTLPTL